MSRGITLLALALLASGCVTPGANVGTLPDHLVSRVTYDANLTLAEHTPIESFDGTVLDAWVFRPDTAETGEKVPVIINFSPYWGNLAPHAATGGDAFSLYLIDYYVPRGYAVALVSARGTGLSDGCFSIGGPTELEDENVVATFFGEAAWSNGNVTATGKSYDGTMAQGLLTKSNPHVRTIVPVSPISELYKYNYFDGVPYVVTGQAFNTYYTAQTSLAQRPDDPQDPTYEETPTRFCDESAEVQQGQLEGTLTGDYTAYWRERNYTALLPDRIDASVFYIHGLGDWNVKPDHMTPWIEALRERDVPLKMWLGDWAHDYPTRADFNETLLRWLDHELKGMPNGIMDEPRVQVQERDGAWRHEDAWPPESATMLRLYPSADGTMAATPGAGDATYPDRPAVAPALPSLPVRDQLVYESEPLAEDMRLSGAPYLSALVSATGPRATLSATLYAGDDVLDHGYRDLAHRSTLDTAEPMTPGQRYEVPVRFFPQDVLLPKGTVLRLVVEHAPAVESALAPVLPLPTSALVTVHHGESTWLELPLFAAADSRYESPQPDDVGCWAC